MARQELVKVKYYDESQTEPMLLKVEAYGKVFHPARVVHGTEFTCPAPAVDNVKIFKIEDYPAPKRKRRTKKVENADITE